jgi:hypothetical protein
VALLPVTTIDPARHKRIHLFRGHDHLTILVCRTARLDERMVTQAT